LAKRIGIVTNSESEWRREAAMGGFQSKEESSALVRTAIKVRKLPPAGTLSLGRGELILPDL